MKRIIILLLLLAISLPLFITPSYGLSLPDDYVVPKINTLDELQIWQEQHPPVGGITWDMFSVLGEFITHSQDYSKESTAYLYAQGNSKFMLYIYDISICKRYDYVDSDEDARLKEFWKPYLSVIDQMTTKEYLDVERIEPDTIILPPSIVWIEPSDLESKDMTILQPNQEPPYKVAYLNDNLVFCYNANTNYRFLWRVEWIHNGLLYRLYCYDYQDKDHLTVYFNETEVDIVRRLTNLETCEEALNELMSEISDNAVAEMPKGMPRDELPNGSGENSGGDTTAPGGDTTAPGGDTTAPGDDATDTGENAIGSDENEENKDSKTDSVLSWVFLGAAGVLVLATALGILLHSRKKH